MLKFLRVSGANAIIDFNRLTNYQTGIEFQLTKRLAQKSSSFLQQMSCEHLQRLQLWCYLANKKSFQKMPNALLIIIASFLPIEYISFELFAKAQVEILNKSWFNEDYKHFLMAVYENMKMQSGYYNEYNDYSYYHDSDFRKRYSKTYKMAVNEPRQCVENDTCLMSILKKLTPEDDIQNTIANHAVCTCNFKKQKYEEKWRLPKMEFQIKGKCLFFIEFQLCGQGINIGFIDYNNHYQHPNLDDTPWPKNQLHFLNENNSEHIDELMSQISMYDLSAAMKMNYIHNCP